MKWALSGFSNDTVWIIFAANMFAVGYEVTGFGRRLGLLLVKRLGRNTLGLGYAIALSDLVLAPFMPSVTARSGGTIYPLVKSIPPIFGSFPDDNPRKIGSYLMWTSFATCCVTSSLFLTSFAPNPLATEIVRKVAHIDISWRIWAVGMLPMGVILFLLTPLLSYILYPPTMKRSTEVAEWAASELRILGRITQRELIMALLAVAALAAWIGAARWVAPTIVALAAVSLMLLLKVVPWSDMLGSKQAWNVLVWFATLVAMAEGLNAVGFLTWFAKASTGLTTHVTATTAMIIMVVVFFVVHYAFASGAAQTASLLPVFLAAAVLIPGIPVRPVSLLLLYSMGLMGVISPYAIGPAPIYFGSGYIPSKDFWRLGFIFGAVYLVVLLGVGLPYLLKVLP
jgi:L-tartrate/succinate antiporter